MVHASTIVEKVMSSAAKSKVEPCNKARLVGHLKEDAFCPGQFPMASLKIIVPVGKDKQGNAKTTVMNAVCWDDLFEIAKHGKEGDLVLVEGMLTHHQNKKTNEWRTQVRANKVECLERSPDNVVEPLEPGDDLSW